MPWSQWTTLSFGLRYTLFLIMTHACFIRGHAGLVFDKYKNMA